MHGAFVHLLLAHLDSWTTTLLWAYASPAVRPRVIFGAEFWVTVFLRQYRRLCHVCQWVRGLPPAARPIPIVTVAPSLLLVLLSKDRDDRGGAPSQHKLLVIYGDVISGEEEGR